MLNRRQGVSVVFDWDEGNREKCQKHGVSLVDIEHVLAVTPRIAPDVKHSQTEARLIAVGRTPAGRPAFVVFTVRGDKVRPLSARFMHAKEVDRYEASGS